MKNINLNAKNVIDLEDPDINDVTKYKVKYSLINEVGGYVKNSENEDLNDKDAQFNSDRNRFTAEFKLHPDSKGKYYRLSFHILNAFNEFIVSDYALIDLVLEKISNSSQLIPNAYFKEYIINGELDDDIKDALVNYPDDGIKEFILAAQDELENVLELSFVPRTIENESHDWFQDNMFETHWQIQMYQWPILSVQSYALYYGTEKFLEIEPQYLQVSRETGLIEYLPSPRQPFAIQIYNISADAMARTVSFSRGIWGSRIPNVFRVSYTHGLDFMNLEEREQAGIRSAIARRTMMKALPRISPEVIKGSEQISVDGVSYSQYNRGIEYLGMQKEAELEWISDMKRKYNKGYKFITV